jgi:hypothetical protein
MTLVMPEGSTNFTVENMVARAKQLTEEGCTNILSLYLGAALYLGEYEKIKACYDFPGSDKDFVIETLVKEAVNNEDN